MTHRFRQSHHRGKEAEQHIYELFQPTFNVIPAPGYLQEQGIDFTFQDRTNHQVHRVELKTDWTADRTGNAFIETVSVARVGQEPILGWAFTSQADWLLYYLPQRRCIYRLAVELLRLELPGWEQRYRVRQIPNQDNRGDYHTVGLLVPLDELNRIAQEVIEF